jgi:hypothetical protein
MILQVKYKESCETERERQFEAMGGLIVKRDRESMNDCCQSMRGWRGGRVECQSVVLERADQLQATTQLMSALS